METLHTETNTQSHDKGRCFYSMQSQGQSISEEMGTSMLVNKSTGTNAQPWGQMTWICKGPHYLGLVLSREINHVHTTEHLHQVFSVSYVLPPRTPDVIISLCLYLFI